MDLSSYLKNRNYQINEEDKKTLLEEAKKELTSTAKLFFEIILAYNLGTRINEEGEEHRHPEAEILNQDELEDLRIYFLSTPNGRLILDLLHFLSTASANSIFLIEEKLNSLIAIGKGLLQIGRTKTLLNEVSNDKILKASEADLEYFIEAFNFHTRDTKTRIKSIKQTLKKQNLTSSALNREIQLIEERINTTTKEIKIKDLNSYRSIKPSTEEINEATNQIFEFLNLKNTLYTTKLI